MTYREFDRKVDLVGRGLMSLGVRPRQNVCILAETRMEWMLTAQACLRINIPVVTLYATLGEDGIIHGTSESPLASDDCDVCVTRIEWDMDLGKHIPSKNRIFPTFRH